MNPIYQGIVQVMMSFLAGLFVGEGKFEIHPVFARAEFDRAG